MRSMPDVQRQTLSVQNPGVWWIVDGYSLLYHNRSRFSSRPALDMLRARLIRTIDALLPHPDDRMTLVFDGQGPSLAPAPEADGRLEILFTPTHQTADAVIERMVASASNPERIVVVTSDRTERNIVSAFGAQIQDCPDFLESLQGHRTGTDAAVDAIRKQTPAARLGDFFPTT